jgi:hypothetical protein
LLRKEELLERVWPDAIVEENNLTVTIAALRKALDEGPADRRYIETVLRRGYRSDFAVAEAGASPGQAPPAARSFPLKGALAACVALAAVLAWLWHRWAAPPASRPVRSMAVLPFRSLADDNDYLGLGMADALITRLGGTKLLVVRSTGTVRRYSAPDLDPVAAGRELGVESVLEGSMQAAGGRLRIVQSTRGDGALGRARSTSGGALRSGFDLGGSPAPWRWGDRGTTGLLTRRYTSDGEATSSTSRPLLLEQAHARRLQRGGLFQRAIEKDPRTPGLVGLDSYINRPSTTMPPRTTPCRGRGSGPQALRSTMRWPGARLAGAREDQLVGLGRGRARVEGGDRAEAGIRDRAPVVRGSLSGADGPLG